MNNLIYFQKRKVFAFVLAALVQSAVAQQGLFLSHRNDTSKIQQAFRTELSGWYQVQADKHAFGGALTYCPYFEKSKSELRVKIGGYGTENKFNRAEDLTYYLLSPGSPSFELATGYTKLFPQKEADNYYELAFNVDVYFTYHSFSIRDTTDYQNDIYHKDLKISTYHVRTGIEVIPIPGILSFYGNVNLQIGVSGKANYEAFTNHYQTETLKLLEKVEFFDAGVKVMIPVFKGFKLTPDVNVIFAEKRIRRILQDSVIPSFKLTLTYFIPIK